MKKLRFATQLHVAQFLSISILLVTCAALIGCGKSSATEPMTRLISFIETSEAKYVSRGKPYDINESCKRQLLDLLANASAVENDVKWEITESFVFSAGKESNVKTSHTLYAMHTNDNKILVRDFDDGPYYEIDSKGFQNLIQEIIRSK